MSENLIHEAKRAFLKSIIKLIGLVGAFLFFKPFFVSLFPSRQQLKSVETLEVDLSDIGPGQKKVVIWQGKPVWIIHRTADMLNSLTTDRNLLRDPDSLSNQQPDFAKNLYRSSNAEYFIVVAVCTHLGCIPKFEPEKGQIRQDWPGGFFCPCHGSCFDLSGRVFKDVPAPVNLLVPPYRYKDKNTIIIGAN